MQGRTTVFGLCGLHHCSVTPGGSDLIVKPLQLFASNCSGMAL